MSEESIIIIEQQEVTIVTVRENVIDEVITVVHENVIGFGEPGPAGQQGPEGPQGLPGPSETSESFIAGEAINSHTPVAVVNNRLFNFDSLNPLHQFSFVGFTKTSAVLNAVVEIEKRIISLAGWGLVSNTPYLAAPAGGMQIVNNTPGSFTKIIGMAQDSETLLIIKEYTSINKN